MKILVVFGTRPEAIKLAPVVRELAARPEFECKVCVTGQHREMLAQVLDLFELHPDWNLDLMRPNQDLAYLTGAVLSGVGEVVASFRPDRVVVQGDTTTTFAAALAAFYHQVPIAHVEAGLRTGNIYAPWPEEVNRRLVGHIADLHFAPTARARDNLLREGIDTAHILVTGNTGIDALLWVADRIDRDAGLRAQAADVLRGRFAGKRLILLTGHRRESFDGGLARIAAAMARIAARTDVAVVFPVHPNPNVRRAMQPLQGLANVLLIEPVDYLELVYLLKKCAFVVTDSGGIQEEAPSFGKPVLVTRETTERPEAVEQGRAKLIGTDAQRLYNEMSELLDDPCAYRRMVGIGNPYGDGEASRRIADRLSAKTSAELEASGSAR
ncbi:MAG TPA: UDP-N-acetylglucosamine 2-epimerase (non-hydrolyzing) [Stellaceae bacterium]